jgi:hypothetical protein
VNDCVVRTDWVVVGITTTDVTVVSVVTVVVGTVTNDVEVVKNVSVVKVVTVVMPVNGLNVVVTCTIVRVVDVVTVARIVAVLTRITWVVSKKEMRVTVVWVVKLSVSVDDVVVMEMESTVLVRVDVVVVVTVTVEVVRIRNAWVMNWVSSVGMEIVTVTVSGFGEIVGDSGGHVLSNGQAVVALTTSSTISPATKLSSNIGSQLMIIIAALCVCVSKQRQLPLVRCDGVKN